MLCLIIASRCLDMGCSYPTVHDRPDAVPAEATYLRPTSRTGMYAASDPSTC
jgi:hypothetical protein